MKRENLIIDHDGGVDDFPSMALQICAEKFKIKAITVCPADSFKEPALLATKKIVDYLGGKDILISGGDFEGTNPFPSKWRDDSCKIAELVLFEDLKTIESNRFVTKSPEEFLAEVLSGKESYIILATGPLTNLSSALEKEPSIKERIERIYVMGGALNVKGNVIEKGHDGSAEWNFYNNPVAAAKIIASGIPITMVGLDATNQTPLSNEFITRLERQSKFKASKLAAEIWKVALKYLSIHDGKVYYFWDTLTSAAMLEPSLIKTERVKVKVITEGKSQGRTVKANDGQYIDVAIWADRDRVEEIFLKYFRK